MDKFGKNMAKAHKELEILSNDISRIMIDKNRKSVGQEKAEDKKDDAKKNFQKVSLKSLQPVTKLYKDEEEIKKANEEPETDFIRKQINNILGKILRG